MCCEGCDWWWRSYTQRLSWHGYAFILRLSSSTHEVQWEGFVRLDLPSYGIVFSGVWTVCQSVCVLSLWVVLAKFVLHMRTNWYFPASGRVVVSVSTSQSRDARDVPTSRLEKNCQRLGLGRQMSRSRLGLGHLRLVPKTNFRPNCAGFRRCKPTL